MMDGVPAVEDNSVNFCNAALGLGNGGAGVLHTRRTLERRFGCIVDTKTSIERDVDVIEMPR